MNSEFLCITSVQEYFQKQKIEIQGDLKYPVRPVVLSTKLE